MKELLKTNAISNPNLLLNSDFKIWQRGEELTVSNGAYCADRWRVYSPNVTSVTFKKVSNGLKVVSTNPVGQSIQIYQLLEHDENLEGVKCTFSQCVNGVVSKRSLTLSNLWGTDKHIQACSISLKEGDVVSWCKTEIGEVATTYVPPNPGDEITKCLSYYENILVINIGALQWGNDRRDTVIFDIMIPHYKRKIPLIKSRYGEISVRSAKTGDKITSDIVTLKEFAIEIWDIRFFRLMFKYNSKLPESQGESYHFSYTNECVFELDSEIY